MRRRARTLRERLVTHTEVMRMNFLYLVGGLLTGWLFSDVWHSWWNLTVPLGFIAVAVPVIIVRRRRERDSNSRGLPQLAFRASAIDR